MTLIQEAINECPVPTIKQYIKRYYVKNNHQWALWALTSTNSLESYHSELKRTTSSQHGLIGACHKVVALDQKKRTDSEYVAFEFRTKKISVIGVDDEILNELHKFPFPIQRMLADEICAVEKRLEKGKATPGLTLLYCNCSFYHRYLLPCRHVFHEHMYGETKLLTVDSWAKFQWMFEENSFEVYMHHESVEVDISEKIKAGRAAENRRLAINELMEKTRDIYWRVEEKGDEKQTGALLEELKSCLEPILNNPEFFDFAEFSNDPLSKVIDHVKILVERLDKIEEKVYGSKENMEEMVTDTETTKANSNSDEMLQTLDNMSKGLLEVTETVKKLANRVGGISNRIDSIDRQQSGGRDRQLEQQSWFTNSEFIEEKIFFCTGWRTVPGMRYISFQQLFAQIVIEELDIALSKVIDHVKILVERLDKIEEKVYGSKENMEEMVTDTETTKANSNSDEMLQTLDNMSKGLLEVTETVKKLANRVGGISNRIDSIDRQQSGGRDRQLEQQSWFTNSEFIEEKIFFCTGWRTVPGMRYISFQQLFAQIGQKGMSGGMTISCLSNTGATMGRAVYRGMTPFEFFKKKSICLYPETEKYESLTIAHNQIIEELITLYNNSFTDENNNHWKIEFWFTEDWKYMTLVLGINEPTLNYFCLWCDCYKNERWNTSKS
ncbi:hypothetical protein Glove_170g30 [Diversispora epigaea]|uniref:SWIM-type domain-containing protein n=1 Tax=Diversispora epigaea TaxID=1348612 RepID=A0A397IVN3_9GLOM|nr:hypothetical protein Glove_170g30 [Diversispora epigaea]